MKKYAFLTACTLLVCTLSSWTPVGNKIKTPWAHQVNPSAPHSENPRPQLVRGDWKSLNGLWDFAITSVSTPAPANYDRQILVPFAPESSLSGVGEKVGKDQVIWYQTTFDVPSGWRKERTLLHFEAVDWSTEVYVNGKLVLTHTGGYTPFSADITPFLKSGRKQTLTVKAYDPCDEAQRIPRGKQVSQPQTIWYTSVSGIWQSVWIEKAPAVRIDNYVATADIDKGILTVDVEATQGASRVKVALLEGCEGYDSEQIPANPTVLAEQEVPAGMPAILEWGHPALWSPDHPYLYGLRISVTDAKGKTADTVYGYASFRKSSLVESTDRHIVLGLNNQPLFQFGPLDQGWWPDGLYTAPTDEALRYDLEITKSLGFNMIRKHIKVEPARWYWYCDRMGILVWQDMPSPDDSRTGRWDTYDFGAGQDSQLTDWEKENYYKEWAEIIRSRKGFGCIVVWIPFNEAWGQFDTEKVVAFTREQDPTRLINPASGGNFSDPPCGDILDCHHYPNPQQFLWSPTGASVVGEFGGIGLPIADHLWQDDNIWGYIQFVDPDAVTRSYIRYAKQLEDLARRGCSGGVYTQTSDVEIEINGLMTYDRKILKVDPERIREANRKVIEALR